MCRYGHAYTLSTVSFGRPTYRRTASTLTESTVDAKAPTFVERPDSLLSVYREEEICISCTVHGEPTPRGNVLVRLDDFCIQIGSFQGKMS